MWPVCVSTSQAHAVVESERIPIRRLVLLISSLANEGLLEKVVALQGLESVRPTYFHCSSCVVLYLVRQVKVLQKT